MNTVANLHCFTNISELLLETHRNDAIFSVVSLRVMPNGKKIVYVATPSGFAGVRWSGSRCVEDAFRMPREAYLTGSEAYGVCYANPKQKTFLLWRSLDNISLIQTT